MKPIDDINLMRIFWDIKNNPLSYGGKSNTLYPDKIKAVIEIDGALQPKHISQEILKKMFVGFAKKLETSFLLDSFSEPLIENICLYLRQDPIFLKLNKNYSFQKSILIQGHVGVGKTLILKAMGDLLKSFTDGRYDPGFKVLPTYKIVESFSVRGFEIFDNVLDAISDNILGIDDLGAEVIATYFGNTINAVGELLARRYDTGVLTHGTTNLNGELLKDFYGERVHDRLAEMVNPLILGGESRRH